MNAREFDRLLAWYSSSRLRNIAFWGAVIIMILGGVDTFAHGMITGDDMELGYWEEREADWRFQMEFLYAAVACFLLPLVNSAILLMRHVGGEAVQSVASIASGRQRMLRAEQSEREVQARLRELEEESDRMDREMQLGPYASV